MTRSLNFLSPIFPSYLFRYLYQWTNLLWTFCIQGRPIKTNCSDSTWPRAVVSPIPWRYIDLGGGGKKKEKPLLFSSPPPYILVRFPTECIPVYGRLPWKCKSDRHSSEFTMEIHHVVGLAEKATISTSLPVFEEASLRRNAFLKGRRARTTKPSSSIRDNPSNEEITHSYSFFQTLFEIYTSRKRVFTRSRREESVVVTRLIKDSVEKRPIFWSDSNWARRVT